MTDKEEKQPHELLPSQMEHRHVLPQGKPKGVATENGKSFEEAGMEPSVYEKHEYDIESTERDAKRGASGSVSSGSTTDSAQSSGGGGGIMGKMNNVVGGHRLAGSSYTESG